MFLSAVKKTARNPWVCHSCRNARRFQSSLGLPQRLFPEQKTLDLTSKAVEALRAEGPARTRFAPSPTGYLHLGSLRTALFNYLVAKATGGQFLLRIEDTDQKRTVPDAEQRLYEDLEWAGVEWDEGPKVGGPYGPYKQSERKALYRKHAEKLVESGHAYRCFCSPTRLKRLAEVKHLDGTSIGYDRKCLKEYTAEQSAEMAANKRRHIIRLKVPKRLPAVDDLVYGKSAKKRSVPFTLDVHNSFDDMVLMKTDRFPTYHLANVVDDHLMKITHVIRGSEWFSSTPKHALIYEAFGWTPPKFAHVGLLLDENRAKLSKRNQDIDISSFRKQGVFPETLTNFVALLGWSHNQPKDIMSMEDLIKNASMKYTRGDTVVSFEKMWFLQKAHAARYASLPPSTNPSHSLFKLAVEPIMEILSQLPIEEKAFFAEIPEGFDQQAYITKILLASAAKYTTPIDFVARNKFFFNEPTRSDLRATVPLLRLGNKNYMIGETIERSNQLGVEKDSSLPPPIIDPSTFLSFINQFQEIREHEWTTTSLKSWIASVTLQASHTKTLEVWRITDPAKRAKVEDKLRKAWSTLVHEYLRWALLASMNGPESAETMIILGRNETLQRLRDAAEIMVQWEQTWEGREQVEMFEAIEERKEWERRERNRDTKRTKMMKWSGIVN